FVAYGLDRERDALFSSVYVGATEADCVSPPGSLDHSPQWAPDARHLAVVSNRSGDPQVWIVDTRTGVARQLTHMPGGVSQPVWRPDGAALAFCASDRIWTVVSAGGTPVPGTLEDGRQRLPTWSPRGEALAFIGDRALNVVEPNGTPRTLIEWNGPIVALAWSPDGAHLAWIGHDQGATEGVNQRVWSLSLATGALRCLTE